MAILAADAVDYPRTRLNDDQANHVVVDAARDVFRQEVSGCGGRVVDTGGKSVLAVFENAIGAVTAALAVQRRLTESGTDLPSESGPGYRVGVHWGDVIEKDDGTVSGQGVNVATRLQALADAGDVAISGEVQSLVVGKVDASFEDRGEQHLENVAEPVHAFRAIASSANRVRKQEGKSPGVPPPSWRFGRFELRRTERQLLIGGEPAKLGARAFDVLTALAERRDRVVGKGELLDVVWPNAVVEENNLEVQVSALRKLMGADAIATVPGRGYRFTIAMDPQPEAGVTKDLIVEGPKLAVPLRHRLLAILAADAVSYSRWMSLDDLATLSALDAARQVFRAEAEATGGRVVDTSGDSILIVFDTAVGAVRAAFAIQQRLSQAADDPTDLRLRFRIGIHLGDVIEKPDGTVYGDGVNIASRLQASAEPGGVIVSQSVQDTCAGHLGAVFEEVGMQTANKMSKPVRALRLVRLRDTPDARADMREHAAAPSEDHEDASSQRRFETSQREATELSPKRTDPRVWWKRSRVWVPGLVAAGVVVGVGLFVAPNFPVARSEQPSRATVNIDQEISNRRATAVLAFVDKLGAKTGSTLGDDLADVIAGRMVHAGLRVIGRAATVRQDPSAPDFVRIGQEQRVRFVVAGRITREGSVMHVDAYLTEIASGAVLRLHEDQFESDEEAMRSDYGNAVVRALRARYYEIETARAVLPEHEKDPVDVVSLAWRDLDSGNSTEERESARSRFAFAVKADPNSEDASYGLGLAYLAQFYCLCSASPREKLDLAEKALNRALKLAPDNPQSLAAWADILLLRQRPDEALRVWRNALEISPDDQNAHVRMASALVMQGQLADAQAHLSRVTNLRPYQLRRQQWLLQTSADASFSQGHDDAAYEILKNWTAEFPNNGIPYLMMAAIDALHGRHAAAAANMARHRQMLPLSTISYVVLTYPSTDPGFLAQRARLVSGLRKAGLPEGDG